MCNFARSFAVRRTLIQKHIMTKTFLKLAVVALTVLVAAGCSGYNKLLKSKNPRLIFDKSLEYYEAGKYTKAIQLLELATPYANSGVLASDSILYYRAASHYKQGDFESSGQLFNQFRMQYVQSPFIEDAEYMLARGYYFQSPEAYRDQMATNRALIAIGEYLDRYPESTKKELLIDNVRELTEKLHDKAYLDAKTYYKIGEYKAAVVTCRNSLNAYPDSRHREELLYLTAKSGYLLAKNSYPELQRDRYIDMIDAYFTFISQFPDSNYVKELSKMHEDAKKFIAKFNTDGTAADTENNNTLQ